MNRCKWMMRAVLSGLTWAWLGVGVAQAGVIPPTDPTTFKLITNPTVTVSLYQLDSLLPSTVTLSSPSRCTTTGTSFYKDVTDCWLPEWEPRNGGKSVFVVVNGTTVTPTLVLPSSSATFPLASGAPNPFVTALTTSAYPGQCTNIGPGTEADFEGAAPGSTVLNPLTLQTSTGPVVGYELKPKDCGGMAVIQVGGLKFILPKDGTTTVAANGLPEIWENLYGGNLSPSGDTDSGPGATTPTGDGLSTADEYRGFIASRKQIRTDPLLKDVFVRLVNPQCLPTPTSTTSQLLVGGYPKPTNPSASATLTLPGTTLDLIGTFTASAAVFTSAHTLGEIVGAGGRARVLAVTSSTTVTALITANFGSTSLSSGSWQLSESLFGTVFGLLSSERVRLLEYTPDAAAGNPLTTSEWVDRFVSFTESASLQLQPTDSASDRVVNANRIYGPAQKGVRVIECIDDIGSTSLFGWALGGTGSPNIIGNVVVYTKRIVDRINLLIDNGVGRSVQYSPMLTYDSRAKDWLPKTLVGAPTSNVKDFVISKALLFYVGMEVGHSLDLNETASANPHFPAGSGDALDAGITVKVDSKTSGFNTFYIPSVYGTADQSHVLIK